MSSNPKWNEKMEITYRDYFKGQWYIPHIGMVRLIRGLENELGKERAHKLVAKVRDEVVIEFYSEGMGDDKVESLDDFFAVMTKVFDSVQGYENSVEAGPYDSPDYDRASKATNCIWVQAYREMDAMDIGYLWECMSDFTMAKVLSSDVKLEMPKCMMLGDDECIWGYKWEGET